MFLQKLYIKKIVLNNPEISKDFTVETEGDEGLSRCSLANKVCLPLSTSFEKGHPLAGAFVPKSLPISSVSAFHSFRCQPISSIPLESNFVLRLFHFRIFLVMSIVVLLPCPFQKVWHPPQKPQTKILKTVLSLGNHLVAQRSLCLRQGVVPRARTSHPPVGRFSD